MDCMLENELDIINEICGNVYSRLVKGIKESTGINGWEVLYDMDYHQYVESETPSELGLLEKFVSKSNIRNDPTKAENHLVCICGKEHIKKCSIMKYNHISEGEEKDYIILGSQCINTLNDFIAEVSTANIPNFKDKIKDWVIRIKKGELKYTKKKCVACKERKITRGKIYVNEARQKWCVNCCSGNKVKCVECPNWRTYMKDWRGKPMKLCYSCYKNLPTP